MGWDAGLIAVPFGDAPPIVIVSGAGRMRSIGRAVAEQAARAGYGILVSDVAGANEARTPEERDAGWRGIWTIEEQLGADGHVVAAIECDLRDRAQIRSIVDAAAALGRIHGVVNSARAPLSAPHPSSQITEEEWDQVMAINIRGALFLSLAAAEQMSSAGGSIVNVSSTAAFSPQPGLLAYSTSKAALGMLTSGLAMELAPRGIRVNAVCPGPTATNRISAADEAAAAKYGISTESVRRSELERSAASIPMGRVATPEDVAGAVLFLLSDAASYVTAESLRVAGGLL